MRGEADASLRQVLANWTWRATLRHQIRSDHDRLRCNHVSRRPFCPLGDYQPDTPLRKRRDTYPPLQRYLT